MSDLTRQFVSVRQFADRVLFDPNALPPRRLAPGTCARCEGTGSLLGEIDSERDLVRVPCYMCHEYCRACKLVQKKGHVCAAAVGADAPCSCAPAQDAEAGRSGDGQ